MSDLQEYLSFLKIHPPFNQMPHDLVEKVASVIRVRRFGIGRTLFRKGEEATDFYIIRRGVVREFIRADNGKETVIALLKSGECFGATSVLTGQRRRMDTAVEEDAELYVISRADIERLFSEDPSMMIYFNRVLTLKLNMFFEYFDEGTFKVSEKAAPEERELSAVNDIARILSSEDDVENALGPVVRILRDWTRTDACSLFLLDSLADRLELRESSGFEIPEGTPVIMKASEGITGWVVKHCEPVRIENASSDPRVKFITEIHEERFKSLLSIPLVAGGESFGAINFHTLHPRKYSYEEIKGVTIAGAQIALALANAKLRKRVEVDSDILRVEKGAVPGDFAGKSHPVKKINEFIVRAAESDLPVFLSGEAGTGKELVARLIHSSGARREGPFLEADCGTFSRDGWGGELFGMEGEGSGSARIVRRGYVERAEGGILFLRNVERLNAVSQVALYNFLDSGFFRRVGGKARLGGNVRIISTCKVPLREMVADRSFNKNAYEALSRFEFKLEPLRKMKRFIPELSDYLLKRIGRQLGRPGLALAEPAQEKILSYDWPGNVTELENVLRGAVILTEGKIIGARHLFFPARSPSDWPVYNLLAHSRPADFLRGRFFPGQLGALSLAAFAVLVGYLLSHPEARFLNAGVWALGWFFIFLSTFFVGRIFCAVCPFMLTGELFRRVKAFQWKCPPVISRHGDKVAVSGIFVILWLEGAFGFHYHPLYTAALFLTITLGAVVCSTLFQRRVWCRYLCPMGSFLETFSLSACLSLSADRYVCTYRCPNHECYVGKGKEPGCQLFLHPYGIESQGQCVLCMQCHKNCPFGAVNLNLQFPATGVLAMVKPSLIFSLAATGLMGVLPVETGAVLGPGSSLFEGISGALAMGRISLYTVLFVLSALLPFLLFVMVEKILGGYDVQKSIFRLARIGYFVLPMAVLGHSAFYLMKALAWTEDGILAHGAVPLYFLSANLLFYALYCGIILLGALGSVHTFIRIVRHDSYLRPVSRKLKAGYMAILALYLFLYALSSGY